MLKKAQRSDQGNKPRRTLPPDFPPCAEGRKSDYSWEPDAAEIAAQIAATKQAEEDRIRRQRLLNRLALLGKMEAKIEQLWLNQIERINWEIEQDRKWLAEHKND